MKFNNHSFKHFRSRFTFIGTSWYLHLLHISQTPVQEKLDCDFMSTNVSAKAITILSIKSCSSGTRQFRAIPVKVVSLFSQEILQTVFRNSFSVLKESAHLAAQKWTYFLC